MYSAGPAGAAADSRPLRVSGAWRAAFRGSAAAAADPMLGVYLADMIRPYGLSLREGLLAAGSGQSFGDMAGELLAQAVPADQPADLVVFAFATSDVIPGRSTAAHLSYRCPGRPMAFAICDQGAVAPFLALRLLREYARTDDCRRCVLVVAEQAVMHYEPAAPAALPARHAAVAVLCGDGGPGRLDAVRQLPGVAAGQVETLLARELASLSAGHAGLTVIAGSGLSAGGERAPELTVRAALGPHEPAGAEVIAAPAGQPCTGLWWALAERLPGWAASGRRVLLADYEPVLGYLCVSAIEVTAGAATPPPSGLDARAGAVTG